MAKRSVGVLALIGICIGVLGSWATGCDLGSGGTIGIDKNPEDEDTTVVTGRVPGSQEELARPELPDQLDANR